MKSKLTPRTPLPTDLRTLDKLIRDHVQQLLSKPDKSAKLGDLLKMIELRYKLAPGDQAQQEFWAMLEEVRREVLPHDHSDTTAAGTPKVAKKKMAKGKK